MVQIYIYIYIYILKGTYLSKDYPPKMTRKRENSIIIDES